MDNIKKSFEMSYTVNNVHLVSLDCDTSSLQFLHKTVLNAAYKNTKACISYHQSLEYMSSAVGVYGEEDWVFCYRWELLQLKREFSVKDTCVLWEV